MLVEELNREQLVELKQRYLTELSDEGKLNEVLYDKPELDETSGGVSYGELAKADELVTDEVVMEHFKGIVFDEEDFAVEDAA